MQRPHPSLAVRRFHPAARHTWTAHLRRATSWVAAGSVAAVLALIGLATHETPAHHTAGSTAGGSSTANGTSGATGGSAPGAATTGSSPTAGSSTGAGSSPAAGTTGATTARTSAPVVTPGSGGTAHVSTGLS